MRKAVIFDVDGTLIDSNELNTAAWVAAFRHFRLDVRPEDIRKRMGMGSDQLLKALFSSDQLGDRQDELRHYRAKIFARDYQPRCCAFPEVRALFKRIKENGQSIVLGSSASRDDLDKNMQIAKIADLVDFTVSADDAEHSKPCPDIFMAALKKVEPLTPADAIVVGDTPYDAQAAQKIGLATIGLLCGGFPESELRAAGCCAIYRDPEHLLREFSRSPIHGSIAQLVRS
ncbi:MAG: phosphorylated carbohydrates phosphatase [Hyphomicrobiales bacterium]|nr:phosphorylated carbohydrates phosphatase [Hyphomicrobiales bacterium]